MTTVFDVCNRAVAQIAEIPSITPVTGINPPAGDSIAAANAASLLYQPIYLAILRQFEWDFAKKVAPLVAATAPPLVPWLYQYLYPADCIQFRQVAPPPGTIDPNDPQPLRHAVADDDRGGTAQKVILANQAAALGVYTADVADPTLWDWGFAEAMVRALASALALTLAGRPDFSREKLSEAAQFESIAESRRS
jgi:hypothetical protein